MISDDDSKIKEVLHKRGNNDIISAEISSQIVSKQSFGSSPFYLYPAEKTMSKSKEMLAEMLPKGHNFSFLRILN